MVPYRKLLVVAVLALVSFWTQGCMTTNQVYSEHDIVHTLSSSPATIDELKVRLARTGGTTVAEAEGELHVIADGPSEVQKWRDAVESSPSWQESLESIHWSPNGSFDRTHTIYAIIAKPQNLTQELEIGPTFRIFEDENGAFLGWVR